MNARQDRIRNLGAAGALAVVAALLAAFALPHHGTPKAQAADLAKTRVFVASRDLPVGTSAAQALASHGLAARSIPAAAVAPGAVETGSALDGKVIVEPIYAGEQVTERRLGATGQAELHADLTGDGRIVQVSGDSSQLLAGTLHDGDHVDIVASVRVGTSQTPESAVAVRNVLVLTAPAASADTTSSSSSDNATATVQLTDAQAARLFFVMKNGDWSFLLRPSVKPAATKNTVVGAGAIVRGE